MRRLVVAPSSMVIGEHTLDQANAHYSKDALRLRAGAELELTDGDGHVAKARLIDKTTIEVLDVRTVARPRGPQITLIQAVGKGDKVDDVVRQASELGVARIVPVLTDRTVAEKRSRDERWRAIADDALRVSGRVYRTDIDPVLPLAEVLKRPRADLALACDGASARGLRDHLSQSGNPARIELIVGPEGGLSDEERRGVDRAGFTRIHLGRFTLRTETAGPAVSAILLYTFGALDSEPI